MFFGTKEEHNAYIAKNTDKLPEGFITWEQASKFGDVYGVVMLLNNWEYYQYIIIDDSGMRFNLRGEHQPESDQLPVVNYTSTMLAQGSLRKITNTNNKAMVVSRNDMEYRYAITGELLSISWYQNGVKTTLDGYIYEYPENRTDTVVGKLLSADESVANAAFAEIKEQLSK